MNKDDRRVHPEPDDNVVEFPKPPPPSGAGGEEDVGDESPTAFYFIPDWDTGKDDPPAS